MAVPQIPPVPQGPQQQNPNQMLAAAMGGQNPMQQMEPPGGVQAGPQPFATPQAFAQAQFTGAGSDPNIQSDLALSRQFETQRQNTMGSNASFDADLRRRADETYAEFERSLNPQWEQRARAFEQSLVGRGIDPNSEAGQQARAQFERDRTDAFSSARRSANADAVALQQQRWQQDFAQRQMEEQARNANAILGANQSNLAFDRDWRERQFNEDRRRYDQGFGEDVRRFDTSSDFAQLMGLLGLDRDSAAFNNQASQQEINNIFPWLNMIPQGGPTGIDVLSPYQLQQNAYQFQQGVNQQQQNGRNQMIGTALQMLPTLMGSDERIKEDIRPVGKLDNGLPVYAFRYKAGGPTQIGVMAQDVEKVNPDAVIEVEGIKMVNYDSAVA